MPRHAPRRKIFPVFWGMSGSYKAMRTFDLNQKNSFFSIKKLIFGLTLLDNLCIKNY
jgi:hypothetical protein